MALSYISNFKPWTVILLYFWAKQELVLFLPFPQWTFSVCVWKNYIPMMPGFGFISYLIPRRLKLWQRPRVHMWKSQWCNVPSKTSETSIGKMSNDTDGGWSDINRHQQRLWAFARSQYEQVLSVTALPKKHNGHLWASPTPTQWKKARLGSISPAAQEGRVERGQGCEWVRSWGCDRRGCTGVGSCSSCDFTWTVCQPQHTMLSLQASTWSGRLCLHSRAPGDFLQSL